ncbi:hypothetical protein PHYBOEH_006752 [Phytophthora boehmeriae]|uniref:Uncharacterized protein n=1 Tax=Phytophthora boehmeriae TaxID=109152 RepID=A0A8T1WBE0_9STRA|nr:hypothetical protein PHYBOEH_006752 [Phytophthora boehmeriae]
MDFLEEFMPGMGDVLAAQEGALMSVVATLSTQMQQLLVTNERQAQRVAQLENSQLTLRSELKELQDAPAPAPVVVEVPAAPDPAVEEAVAMLSTKMEQLQQDVQQQVTEQMQQALSVFSTVTTSSTATMDDLPARMLLEAQVRALELKVTAEIGQLRGEAADSLTERTKLTEETFKDQLEQIEKRFDYLLGVKMEVKELTRRVDRQEKSLDDVRTAIEVLAKSLGTDDVDSESNDEGEESLEQEAPMEPPEPERTLYSARRISLRSAPKSRPQSAVPIADAVPEEVEVEATKEDDVPPVEPLELPHDSARNINTPVETPHADVVEVAESTPQQSNLIQQEVEEPSARGTETVLEMEALIVPIVNDEFPLDNVEPIDSAIEPIQPVDLVESIEPVAPEPDEPEQPEPVEPEPVEPETVELTSEVLEQEVAHEPQSSATEEEPSPEQSEGERTTETEVIPTPAVEAPTFSLVTPASDQTEEVMEQVESPHGGNDEIVETKQDGNETARDTLTMQYRSRMVDQQKQHDDRLDLFRPTPSAAPSARPTVLTSSVRTRHQQRRHTNSRKSSNVQIAETEPPKSAGSRTKSMFVHSPPATPPLPVPDEPRVPLTKAAIRQLWLTLLSKLVRLYRLRQLNGLNAERALFRKQQTSMGSRVKRLEETNAQLGDALEYLERQGQDSNSAITALDEAIVELQPLTEKVDKLERAHKTQARVIVDVEEKIQELGVEVQRLRTSAHRMNSMNSNVSTAVTTAISAQLQDVSSKFTHHLTAFQNTEKMMVEVSETEIPAIHDKIELSLYTLRQEAEQRASEATAEVQKLFDQLQNSQRNADGNLVLRITEFCNRIYRTLLGMSDAMLQSVELSKVEQTIKKTARSPLEVGIEFLQGIFMHFTANCKALMSVEAESEIEFLVEAATDFQQQLEKLTGQAAIAKAATQSLALDAGNNNDTYGSNPTPVDTSQNSSFCDHLVFITTTKLKVLEKALLTQHSHKTASHAPELILHLNDVVVQVRAVLFLLLLHAETMDSRNQVEDLRTSQGLIQNKVIEQGFAIGQLESIGAVVKLMNSRLDTFIEYSFAYAKEDDVKKSIEELMTANSEMRDLVTSSLEATRSETLERDGLLGEEMNQLIARVSKKLDKDELLWTQEVLERQVQNVANASLDEHDLVDIHRRLRRKVDKDQLKSLLVDQSGRVGSSSGSRLATTIISTEDHGPKAPLVGAKCISCQGDLPPTKAMIKNAVREEVQQEIAKSRAQKLPSSSLPTFSVSNHRSLEAFKKELLLSALQQQKPSSK